MDKTLIVGFMGGFKIKSLIVSLVEKDEGKENICNISSV